jgi:hypothetical protein
MPKPTPAPNGLCWCDCGGKTKPGSYFMQGHDKRAERYLEAVNGRRSIADKLAGQSFVPGQANSLREAVLAADPTYEECGLKTTEGFDCRVIGKGVGMRRHRADDTQHSH